MDVDQLLTTTRSARKALDVDAPVDLAEIRDCLDIGLHAPNGSNQQSHLTEQLLAMMIGMPLSRNDTTDPSYARPLTAKR